MTVEPALLAETLSKSYGRVQALQSVSLRLPPGRFQVLLGPNGAGKSTLLQLLTGLFHPDTGRVVVMGHDMARQPARALAHLGVVFQQSALDLDLSVQSNLYFHTDLHGLSRASARARIEAITGELGMALPLSAPTRALSGGNRRKVELVRALLHRPSVLLMDEATVGLDPASREQLLASVRRLCHEQGMAALWTTHLLEEAEAADHLTVLRQGRVDFEGTPTELVAASTGDHFKAAALERMNSTPL
jgi:ABC-2 type transport system ATP-binding protein